MKKWNHKGISLTIAYITGSASLIVPLIFYIIDPKNNNVNIPITLIIIGANLTFLTYIASKYLESYFDENKSDMIKVYHDNLDFSKMRRDQIKKLNKDNIDVSRNIYATSHCNLFFDFFDLDEDKENLERVNKEFFEELCKLAYGRKLNICLFIYYDNDRSKLEKELYQRVMILNKYYPNWSPSSFSVREFKRKGMKDYLVVHDIVFKTIRKTKSTALVTFAYARGVEISKLYREWLKDLYINGEESGELKNSLHIKNLLKEMKKDISKFDPERKV